MLQLGKWRLDEWRELSDAVKYWHHDWTETMLLTFFLNRDPIRASQNPLQEILRLPEPPSPESELLLTTTI